MAQHVVKFSLPKAEVLHADLQFNVRRNGSAFGKLLVSKGAIVWRRKGKFWRGKKFNWSDFDRFMQEHGRPEHRRPSKPRSKKKNQPRRSGKARSRRRA